MLVAKQVADLITYSRGLMALVLAGSGLLVGKDALPLTAWVMFADWCGDMVDGPIARRSRVYYHSWIGDRELFVAGPSITYIGVPDPGARGRGAPRGPITLRYLNAAAKEDGIAIRVPYAEQWAETIRTRLIGRKG